MKRRVLAAMAAAMVLFSACAKQKPREDDPAAKKGETAEFVPGECNDVEFISEFDELRFTLPEGWYFASDEDLMNLMDVAMESDLFTDKGKRAQELARQTTVYEMVASDLSTGISVLVTNENTKLSSPLIKMDEEKYAHALKSNLSKNTVVEYVYGEFYWTELAGNRFIVLPVQAPEEGYRLEYYFRAIGSRMLGICVSRPINSSETELKDILACFSNSSDPAPAAAPIKKIPKGAESNSKRVGDGQFGYVDIPGDWVVFVEEEGGTDLQFCDPTGTNIITMNVVDLSALTEEEQASATLDIVSMNIWQNIKDSGGKEIEGAKVKLDDYDANQILCTFDDGVILIAWVFQTEDGTYRYVSAEGPPDTIESVISIAETYSLEK